ncbi:FIST N-terminal domain-containing protein, partial [Alloalcanivorax venustensis]
MNAIPPSAVITAFSDARDERLAARDLAQKLRHDNLGCVLFFCSIDYRLDRLAGALAEAFGDLPLCGCTSAGEITSRGYDSGTIVAIGFDRRFFSVGARLIERLDGFSLADAQQLTDSLLCECRAASVARVDADNTFVLTLLDGLSVNEELVLAT